MENESTKNSKLVSTMSNSDIKIWSKKIIILNVSLY